VSIVDRRVFPPRRAVAEHGPRIAGGHADLLVAGELERHGQRSPGLHERASAHAPRQVVIAIVALEQERRPADFGAAEPPRLDGRDRAVRAEPDADAALLPPRPPPPPHPGPPPGPRRSRPP